MKRVFETGANSITRFHIHNFIPSLMIMLIIKIPIKSKKRLGLKTINC